MCGGVVVEFGEPATAVDVDGFLVLGQDLVEDPLPGAEVVRQRRGVALARGGHDLSDSGLPHALFGEEAFGLGLQSGPGLGAVTWHVAPDP